MHSDISDSRVVDENNSFVSISTAFISITFVEVLADKIISKRIGLHAVEVRKAF